MRAKLLLDLLPHPFYVPASKAAHRFGLAPFLEHPNWFSGL